MRLWVTGKERRERGSEKVTSARETEERRTIQWKEREWATNGAFEGTREKVLLFPVRGKKRERADEARLDKRKRECERGRERAGTRQSAPTEPPPYHLQHSRPAHTVAAAPPPWFARVHMRDCARVHLSLARNHLFAGTLCVLTTRSLLDIEPYSV